MEFLAHLQEIKLLATLTIGYFCYRKISNAPPPCDIDDLSDSE